MREATLRALASTHLLPFFSGATIEQQRRPSTRREQLVAFAGPQTILFKVARNDPYRLALRRSQEFDQTATQLVTELGVVKAFVDVVQEIEPGLQQTFASDLLSAFERRVVAKAVAPQASQALLDAIDQLNSWGLRLYEGGAISAAFGFDLGAAPGGGIALTQLCREDFSAVLSNGFDTLLTFDSAGGHLGYESLVGAGGSPSSYAPFRQSLLADWTANDRVALALNRLGEILVFRDSRLLFARRSGAWHFLPHSSVLKQMAPPRDRTLREAILESALDASFARSGACIGVVTHENQNNWTGLVTEPADRLEPSQSTKAKVITAAIGQTPFQQLDRRLRQEILAIDGATVLDHGGRILAVGAILKIPGGSTGGGRLAAAIELGKLGLGVKVSQDGRVSGYKAGRATPAFVLM